MEQDSAQIYSGNTANGYRGFAECDHNVYRWAQEQLRRLVRGKRAIDAGCGKCDRLGSFEGADRYIGIEAATDMIREIPNDTDVEVLPWRGNAAEVEDAFLRTDRVVIHGKLQDVCPHIQADVAASLFNVICFALPREPINCIGESLKPGGKVLIVSNVMVPRYLNIDGKNPYRSTTIDIQNIETGPELPATAVFRQVLHLQGTNGKSLHLPLQDHAHTLHDYQTALPAKQWNVENVHLYPPQRCTYVDPNDADSPFTGMHENFPTNRPIYSQRL